MEKQMFYEKVGHLYKLTVEVLDVNLVVAGKDWETNVRFCHH